MTEFIDGAEKFGSDSAMRESVYRVVVRSDCALMDSLDQRCADLAALIASTRRTTPDTIAGILGFHRGRLHLALEGPQAAVETARDRITHAFVHLHMRILVQGHIPARRLPRHAMLFVSGDPRAQQRLSEALDRGAAEAGAETAEAVVEALALAAEDQLLRTRRMSEVAEGTPGQPDALEPLPIAPHPDAAPSPCPDTLSCAEPASASARSAPAAGDGPVRVLPAPLRDASADAAEAEALDATFGSAVLSVDRHFLRANPYFAELFGYRAQELAGRPYTCTLHESDDSHLDRLWAAMARGETVRVERRGRRRDGADIWLRSTYRPRLDATGLRDVTEITVEITREKLQQLDERGQITAINRAQAVVHFDLDGVITQANDLFLAVMGYARAEVIGRHHRMFVEAGEADGPEYAAFWQSLAAGYHRAAEFRRVAKGGYPVWLQATYNPILDMAGRPFKVVKYATDVTAEKLLRADYQWQIAAIQKSNAVVTFDMSGIILEANDNFLAAFGYAREDVIGYHHRTFVEDSYAHGAEYADFWGKLGQGLHQSGQYKRVGRDGREIWLQATYNPIFDMDGRPFKIVKYATIVTAEKLRQAEHQSQIAAIHKAQAVVSFGLDGTVLDANRKFLDTMGYRLGEVRGHHHRMFVEPEQAAGSDYASFWAELAAGTYKSGDFKRVGRDGREIWLQATYNPIFDMDGRPFKIVKYAVDVTAEKLRQAAIDGQLTAIHRSQGVVSFAPDGTILDVNDTFLTLVGYGRAELVGRHHSMLVDPVHAASVDYAAFWETLRAGNFLSDRVRRIGKAGREVWMQATYNPVLGLDGRPFQIVKLATDVTGDVAMAEAYRDAQRQAQHDASTALPNRVRLASHMAAALANPGGRLAVLYLDLDRFKPINDSFGHHVGDRVLGEIADRLRRSLGPDQLAARVGGDEFVVVAPDLADTAIEVLCQRLLDAIAAPIPHEGTDLTVGASIGVSISPADGRTADELLRAADGALYRSKQSGRGIFSFYDASMNERVLAYRNLVEDMRRGLATGEFFLEYQPRFGTRTRTIRNVEALIRWAHPERGRIESSDFIPIAERSGLIVPLGEWVLRTACRTAAGWPEIGVSVNVSPVQVRNGDLVGTVCRILAETGLAPRRLELELTEGVLLESTEMARATLGDLKKLGIGLAMDDFGTGYSSIGSLRNFPFDVIKIDRQFVAGMEENESDRGVNRAILALGSSLGMSVTADGVETPGQLRMLTENGCDEVQGYHLAEPMSAQAILDLLGEPREVRDRDVAAR